MQRSELILETWKQKLNTEMIRGSVGVDVSATALAIKAFHPTPFVCSLMPKANTYML